MTTTQQAVVAGLAEIHVSDDPDVLLTCLGLGSCVGLTAYDGVKHVGGLAHIVLPESKPGMTASPGKFADLAVPALISQVVKLGAVTSRLVFKAAGGAQMARLASSGTLFAIGERNAEGVERALALMGKRLSAASLGGDHGRTIRLSIATGALSITSAHLAPFDI